MKPVFTLLIFILLQTFVSAQVTIKEIKRQPDVKFWNTKDSTIIYPIVNTGASTVDEKINFLIRSELLDPDTAVSQGLISMSYEITFNRDSILSFTVTAESCAAYCSHWQSNFNFNTVTGNVITTDDIVKSDSKMTFKNYFMAAKVAELMKYKEELKQKLGKEVDKETYNAAIEIVDSYCINSLSLKKFSLSDSGIEIFDECEFPHVINNMAPVYHLKYSYNVIKELLKPEWRKILMK